MTTMERLATNKRSLTTGTEGLATAKKGLTTTE